MPETAAYLVNPIEAGIKSHVLTLINGLDRSKFEPVLICPPGTSWAKEANCRVIPLNMAGEISIWRDFWAAVRLRLILRRVRPKILHIQGMNAGLVGRLAVAMMRRRPRAILTVHGFVFDERISKWRRRPAAWMERRMLRHTDRIVAVSNALRDELVSEMGLREDKVQVIYNGIAFRDLPRPQHMGAYIGTVARFVPGKGLDHFLQAAALVKSRFPEARFFVIGGGPNKYWVETIVKACGIEDCVELMGFRRDALQIVAGWDVFVLAADREPFSLALAEAMSQGVPTVASDAGGLPEIVDGETTGLLAEAGDAEDFADKICLLLEDRELAGRMAKAGDEFVRANFTAERMVAEVQNLYQLSTFNAQRSTFKGRMGRKDRTSNVERPTSKKKMGLIGRMRQRRRMKRLRKSIGE